MKKMLMIGFILLVTAASFSAESGAATPLLTWKLDINTESEYVEIQMKVQNSSSKEITLEFPSSKFFDYVIRDEGGRELYKYSEGKSFLQAIQRINLKSGETKIWRDKWNYQTHGKRVPAGKYTLKVNLLLKSINGQPANVDRLKTVEFKINEENPSFKKVELIKKESSYIVKGEAKVSAGCFYYTVEDGHKILVEETLVKVNKEYPNWAAFSFRLNFDPSKPDGNRPLLLNLYERDLKDGTIYHTYTKKLN